MGWIWRGFLAKNVDKHYKTLKTFKILILFQGLEAIKSKNRFKLCV